MSRRRSPSGALSFLLIVLVGGALYAGLSLGALLGAVFAADSAAGRDAPHRRAGERPNSKRYASASDRRIDSIACARRSSGMRTCCDSMRSVNDSRQMADLDTREFDFSIPPASGGPETPGVAPPRPTSTSCSTASNRDSYRAAAQMGALENLIMQRELRAQILPDGRPVNRGFISSYFGDRQDPAHRTRCGFSTGVDFAGNINDPVVSVGAGIVAFAGDQPGYGAVVEVTHGDAADVTRYGHNARIVAKQGDTVQRGQTLALMGSSRPLDRPARCTSKCSSRRPPRSIRSPLHRRLTSNGRLRTTQQTCSYSFDHRLVFPVGFPRVFNAILKQIFGSRGQPRLVRST
jgi:murein DD-endopeptidase MepM/ murein hydrolase activator NlpD